MRQLLLGGTGSGKTYKSVNLAKNQGRFIYVAPARQLVYETFLKYGDIRDRLSTGEISIPGWKNIYAVYESLNGLDLQGYSTIIIDEAHFLTDDKRNEVLLKIVENFQSNLLLCTATDNFSDVNKIVNDFEKIELPSRVKFTTLQISEVQFFQRVAAGEPSIYFHKFEAECGNFGGHKITGQTSCEKRLKAQLAFEKGDITFIECTNVLAQGVNFPATNVLIEFNEHDTPELIHQKLGRLGRFGFGHDENSLMTYACKFNPNDVKVKKRQIPEPKKELSDLSYLTQGLEYKNILSKELFKDLKDLKPYEMIDFLDPKITTYNVATVEILKDHDLDIKKVLGVKAVNKYEKIMKSRENLKLLINNELMKKEEVKI